MSKLVPPFTADSAPGRTLIALRAGPLSNAVLEERLSGHHTAVELRKAGYVEQCEAGWQLTAAGRAVCPLRNALAGSTPTAPAKAISARKAPLSVLSGGAGAASHPQSRHSTTKEVPSSGGLAMPLYVNPDLSPINQVRQRLAAAPQGISRRELLRDLKEISVARIDNAVFKLCGAGEAERPKMGVLVATDRLKRMVPLAPTAGAEPAPVVASSEEKEPPTLKAPEPLKAASESAPVPIKFSIDSDGYLSIVDGDEALILPPDATRRLGHFLGCFDCAAY